LKSINQFTVGQGEAAIKSAVTLAAALIGGGAPGVAPKALDACVVIAKLGGGKPVTLTYATVIPYKPAQSDALFDLPVTPASRGVFNQLSAVLPTQLKLGVIVDKPTPVESGAAYLTPSSGSSGVVELTLQKTANVKVEVTGQGATFATSSVTAPGDGTYTLAIPTAALFGKQSLQVNLSEAGAVTLIDYGKLTGAAGALNAANSIATAAEPPISAQVSEAKAQADLIAAQQRLVRCQAKPAQCQ
jgi:hypothetical protein